MRMLLILAVAGIILLSNLHDSTAASQLHPQAKTETVVTPTTSAGVLALIKISMPPAPDGWVVESESMSDTSSDDSRPSYSISYKRVAGIPEETKKIEELYAALVTKMTESASSQTGELLKRQAEAGQALKKAQQRKEIGRERKLKKELALIDEKLHALPAEASQQLNLETEPYLVKDTKIDFHIALNNETIDFPNAAAFSRPKAAFAMRRESERVGPTGWKVGSTLLLYGDWQEVHENSFRARINQPVSATQPQTIVMTITGEKTRIDQFIKKIDMKSILGLLK